MTRPDEHPTFAPVPVAAPRQRGWSRIVAVGWLVVVLAVLVAGVAPHLGAPERGAGGVAEVSTQPQAVAATGAAHVASQAAASTSSRGFAPVDLVSFDVRRAATRLEVKGTIGPRSVVRLSVAVTDANGRPQDEVGLWVDDPNGGLRPAYQRTFQVSFMLPKARASWPVWVKVTAFDAVGGTIGALSMAAGTSAIPRIKIPLKVNATYVR